jgi:LDH2 family malate/lactate/ureidoglycolate dehydrogenase
MHLVPIAEKGLLCQVWAQNSTCRDAAPLGGIDARFSTNPIALAFPADGQPVVADFSTTTMSMAGAHALSEEGRTTPVPRFLDKGGNPSCDPAVMDDDGTLMFMGCEVDGHKGYALSLFNEALTAMAGGSANNPAATPRQSFALQVLDPAAFGGAAHYAQEMRRFVAHLRSARLRPGCKAIRLPGERGFAALAECRLHGVPLDDRKVALLRKLAAENGIAPPV